MSITEIQKTLVALGYDLGPKGADGVWGRRSIAALKAFQAKNGLKPDGIPGPATATKLDPHASTLDAVPVWYGEALRLKGVREAAGKASNPLIMGWAQALGGWVAKIYTGDDIPWCGLFTAHCIGAVLPDEPLPANPLSALAWGTFGRALDKGRLGAVVVFKRAGGGHVGLYAGEDAAAIHVLGGNQSDAVTVARVAKSRLVGFRWPASVPVGPAAPTVALRADAPLSANEA